MKKHISIFLIFTLLFTAVFSFGGVALAAPSFTVTPNVTSMAQGGSVTFEYSIVNDTNSNISGSIVCTTNGRTVVESVVAAPGLNTGTFNMDVSNDLLGQTITFKFGEQNTATTRIEKRTLNTKIGVSATASNTLVDVGSAVKFTFKVENQGETTLENVVIKAPELRNGKALNNAFSLAPGESKTVEYSHTMTEAFTANATVSYTAGGVAGSQAFSPITITPSTRKSSATLTADKTSPAPGEEVTFTLTLKNEGNVPYTDIRVLANGITQSFPSKLNANSEATGTFKMTFQTSTDVSCTVTLKDHTGEDRKLTSNTVSINLPVDQSIVSSNLKFEMSVDRPQLTSAGRITFKGYITNGTSYDLTNIMVNEAVHGNVFSANSLAAGQKENVEWSVDINETSTYNFTLTATDSDGNPYTIPAVPVTVTVQAPTEETPGFDDAADVTGIPLDNTGGGAGTIGALGIIAIVLVVLILGVGAALFVLWKKGQSPKKPSGGQSLSSAGRKRPSSSSYSRGGTGKSTKRPSAPKSYRDRNNF